MTEQAIRAENIIQKLLDRSNATPDGAAWLDCALDPFKDIPKRPSGYPDMINANSIIQVVKESIDIATVSGASNWDCNIFLDGALTNVEQKATTYVGSNVWQQSGQGVTSYDHGGVVIRQAAAGTALYVPTRTANLPLSVNYYNNSSTRVIGTAFEVENTTAEINRQGSVTYYRVPGAISSVITEETACIDLDGGATACQPYSCPLVQMGIVPETLAQAQILPYSKTFKAKEGAYIVAVFADNEIEPSTLPKVWATRVSNGVYYGPTIAQTGAAKQMFLTSTGDIHQSPFTICGAYFTGLSQQTTLRVTKISIVERFPNFNNTDLAVLAYPSSPFDPIAMHLYTQLANTLPTGVPVAENGFGDWIMGIAKSLSAVIPEIGPFIPMAETVINGLSSMTYGDQPKPTFEIKEEMVEKKVPQRRRRKLRGKGPVLVQGSNTQPVTFEVITPQQSKQKAKNSNNNNNNNNQRRGRSRSRGVASNSGVTSNLK